MQLGQKSKLEEIKYKKKTGKVLKLKILGYQKIYVEKLVDGVQELKMGQFMDSTQLTNNIQNIVKVGWHDDFMSATFQPD